MTARALGAMLRSGAGRIRLVGAAVLALLVLLTWHTAPWTTRLQAGWFDAHQALAPRRVSALPVTIVAIDQDSLKALGQWPWPRTQLARLIDIVNAAHPAAIGIILLMPEADALSPERVLAQSRIDIPGFAAAMATRPSNDAQLADALGRAPTVLAVAGLPEPADGTVRVAPITVRALGKGRAEPALTSYDGALTSIPELDDRASGWGLISVDPTRGIVRRIPLVSSIGGTLVPTLAMEMLRVAFGAPGMRLTVDGRTARSLEVGGLKVPTEADGAVRMYFSPPRNDRFVSAVDVLQQRVDPALLHKQLVIIGPRGVGLADVQDTPLGVPMSSSEIHAQLLENIVGGTLLRRPGWAPHIEAIVLLLLGGVLVWAVPRWRPFSSALALLVIVSLPVLAGFALFRWQRLLFDAATPGLSLLLLFGVLLVGTLAESTRQRRALQGMVHEQRLQGARLAGELEAAQRIQTATLPRADLLRDDPRVELHAALSPAREVGGDLYDYFMLDAQRLFLLVGDVAGKGLSASIFMAVTRALYKSAMLRAPHAEIGEIMRVANAEISRDNPQMLFVTAFAAILDLDSGELAYCNAGQDNPYLLHPSRPAPARIADGDGPPLCAVADYAYEGARRRLLPGEVLCLMTDGVAEAQNPAGALYGTQRLQRLLQQPGGTAPSELVARLHADVLAFAAGAEPADDLTILALRWRGR